ncbi:hypothetical protein GCM10016234_05390 [Tianweitania populi]|uniref:Uncharacterized protein n=2 Tax=Tianweitania populi TaxID=1607949 RepID=A0A8J3GIE3_9HYPH|nr:hypothetical protein GCM10016234_05390 [Tianweitania populi]
MAAQHGIAYDHAPLSFDHFDGLISSQQAGTLVEPKLNGTGKETAEGLLVTYGAVQRKLREVGIVMSKPNGRYRINFFGGQPSTEQLIDELEAVLEAGLKLASTRKGPAW